MGVDSNPPARDQIGVSGRLRALPSVDDLLNRPALMSLSAKVGREIVTRETRDVLVSIRSELKSTNGAASALPNLASIESRIVASVEALLAPSLRGVMNATGVILHTNLGRAPL